MFALILFVDSAGLAGMAAAGEEDQPLAVMIGRPLSERGTLIVGATSINYPYNFIGPAGKLTGFGTDLLDAVARVMNLKIHRVIQPGRQSQENFRNGGFDLLQDLSQTLEREKYADFSVPYLTLPGSDLCAEA